MNKMQYTGASNIINSAQKMRSRNDGGARDFCSRSMSQQRVQRTAFVNKLRREKMADLKTVILNTYYFLEIWL